MFNVEWEKSISATQLIPTAKPVPHQSPTVKLAPTLLKWSATSVLQGTLWMEPTPALNAALSSLTVTSAPVQIPAPSVMPTSS